MMKLMSQNPVTPFGDLSKMAKVAITNAETLVRQIEEVNRSPYGLVTGAHEIASALVDMLRAEKRRRFGEDK